MTHDEWFKEITGMIMDVNPAEICYHIDNKNLFEWCLRWQQKMQMLVIQAPIDYSEIKEDDNENSD